MQEELIFIGRITKPQGNRGEVRVMPLTDHPRRFESLSEVFLVNKQGARQEAQVEYVRYMGQMVVLKLSGCESINDAQNLVGAHVAIPESDAVPLPADIYFQHQLIRLKVYTDQGEFLGMLEEIIPGPGNDVYVVRNGAEEILLPAIRQVIRGVDLAGRRMTVHLIPGLKNPDAL